MDGTTTAETQAQTQATPATAQVQTGAVDIPNPDNNHQVVEMKFGFRTIKDEKSGVETKRPTVEVKLPVLNFNGLVNILQQYQATAANLTSEDAGLKAAAIAAKKEYDLLMGAVQNVYEASIKDYLGENANVTSQTFPHDQFTWTALANQPESERRGRGIAKEVWEDFIKSYNAVMPAATGKSGEVIQKQAAILAQKLNPLRNHEDKDKILPKFKEALTVYMNVAPDSDKENFAGCVEFLNEKADRIMNAEKQADLMQNLGF